ncbi:hypothetical protein [Streptomyces nigrescens]|uniref:hypothetical protein n=1 Tax=Streptomyces nigrescens TaxID=1920 RepID=UPI003808E400
MALYHVVRTDRPGPGEFVDAHVIAGGVRQAREAVGHMDGVTKDNVRAVLVDLTKEIRVITAYFDETAPMDRDNPLHPDYFLGR